MSGLRIVGLLALSFALTSAVGCANTTTTVTTSGHYSRGGVHRDSFPDRVYRGPAYGRGSYSRY